MVDRIEYDCGIGSIGDRSDTGEFRVKESSKKRRRPDVSPHIKDKIASLLPEESSESPVGSFSNNSVIVIPRTCQSTVQRSILHLLVKVRQTMLKRTRIKSRWTSSGRESGKRSSPVVLK